MLVGPTEVSDLASLGMNNRISSVMIIPFRAYDSAMSAPEGGVTLYGSYSMTGKRSTLRRGAYSNSRLASEEVKMPGKTIFSLSVEAHMVAILYSGNNFETTSDAVLIAGPTVVEDLDRLGMHGRVNSIQVMLSDPFDVPGRPTLPLGPARAYTPGGMHGYAPGPLYPTQALSTGALDLLMPESSDPSSPSNWAGAPPTHSTLPAQDPYRPTTSLRPEKER